MHLLHNASSAVSFDKILSTNDVRSVRALAHRGQIQWVATPRHRTRPQSQVKSTMMPPAQQTHQELSPASPEAVDKALRAAEALLDSIKQGGGSPRMSSSDLGYTDFGYACDASGCVLVVQQDSTNTTEAPFQHMLSGTNWSLGLMTSSAPYVSQSFATASFGSETTMEQDPIPSASSSSHAALVSGPSWRVFLSAADFADFVHMLGQLRMAVASLRFQGLWNAGGRDRPPSRAKWEGQRFKLTAVFAPGEPGFTVQMVFRHEADDFGPDVREVCVCWPAEVTAAAVAALDDTLGLRPMAARGT